MSQSDDFDGGRSTLITPVRTLELPYVRLEADRAPDVSVWCSAADIQLRGAIGHPTIGDDEAVATTIAYVDSPVVSQPYRYVDEPTRRSQVVHELTGVWVQTYDGHRSVETSSRRNPPLLHLLHVGRGVWVRRRANAELWFADPGESAESASRRVWIDVVEWLVHWRVSKQRPDATPTMTRPSIGPKNLAGEYDAQLDQLIESLDDDDELELTIEALGRTPADIDDEPDGTRMMAMVADALASMAEVALEPVATGAAAANGRLLRWMNDAHPPHLLREGKRPSHLKRAGVEAVLVQLIIRHRRATLVPLVWQYFTAAAPTSPESWFDPFVSDVAGPELLRIECWEAVDRTQTRRIVHAVQFALAQVIRIRLDEESDSLTTLDRQVLTFLLRSVTYSLRMGVEQAGDG